MAPMRELTIDKKENKMMEQNFNGLINRWRRGFMTRELNSKENVQSGYQQGDKEVSVTKCKH